MSDQIEATPQSPTQITSEAVFDSIRGTVALRELNPTQKAAFHLAIGVGSLIALLTLGLVVQWLVTAPFAGLPGNLDLSNKDAATAYIEGIDALTTLHLDQSLRIFDDIVTKALLPIFATILGYLFGKSKETE